MIDPETTTLAEAWAIMATSFRGEGARCLLCQRYLKIYYRNIGKEVARVVARLHRWNYQHPWEWGFLSDLVPGIAGYRGDYAWGKHWKLIEQLEGVPREDGYKYSGYWRVTPLGSAWVRGQIVVPRYAVTFRTEFLRFSDYSEAGHLRPRVSFQAALGQPFDYDRFMAGEG